MNFNKLLIVLLFSNLSFAQVAKDTSYTIHSEYNKQVKKFPFLEIVTPNQEVSLFEQKDIVYYSIDTRDLHLDAFLSKSTTKLPAVILIHGGGWYSGDKSMLHPMAQQIAKHGYQCFTVEYRLSNEAIYPAAIDDVLKAIEFLRANSEKYNLDSDKIAVLGCSSGAQMASLIGTKYPSHVKAVINIDGILAFHHPLSKEGKLASLWLGGTYEQKKDVWNEASALSHVDKNTPSFLFINSQYDRFHAGRDEMIAKMNEFSIYSKIETIAESPHTFWLFNPWFKKTINFIVTFLTKEFKS